MSGYLHFYADHPSISKITEALNSAGSAYHHTESWEEVEDYNAGKSWSYLIQCAIDDASIQMTAAQAQRDKARNDALEQAAKVCEQPSDEIQVTDELSKYTYKDCFDCAAAIRAMKVEK